MFDLLDRPLHWIEVSWPALIAPEDENQLSEPGKHSVELRVEIIDRDEAQFLFPALFPEDDEKRAELEEKFIGNEPYNGKRPDSLGTFKRVVKSWRKIKSNGRRVEMTDANINLLLSAPMFEASFATSYVLALGGRAEIREKNSPGSPSDGREAGESQPEEPTPLGERSKETVNVSD